MSRVARIVVRGFAHRVTQQGSRRDFFAEQVKLDDPRLTAQQGGHLFATPEAHKSCLPRAARGCVSPPFLLGVRRYAMATAQSTGKAASYRRTPNSVNPVHPVKKILPLPRWGPAPRHVLLLPSICRFRPDTPGRMASWGGRTRHRFSRFVS